MHFGGRHPHLGGVSRFGGLPVALHIVGIFLLIVIGIAVAILAHSAAQDWARRNNPAYAGIAGAAAVIAVILFAGWLALKILGSGP
ncbi:MAG TPA: hypothetical protein VK779_10885 [Rhizomicrobium sp.]|jgi:hypothetical protein|nr:hypothetical protein [Rhizomicrobium sp.]